MKDGFSNDLLRISSDGRMSASHTGVLPVVCTMDVQKFPFDTQECSVILMVDGYLPTEVTMKLATPGLKYTGYGSSNGHSIWELSKTSISAFNPTVAIIELQLQRKSLYYTCTMIVPSALLSILTLGAFFIPNDSGEKISCGLAIFLSFVVFLIQMGDIVPENSNGISVVGT